MLAMCLQSAYTLKHTNVDAAVAVVVASDGGGGDGAVEAGGTVQFKIDWRSVVELVYKSGDWGFREVRRGLRYDNQLFCPIMVDIH